MVIFFAAYCFNVEVLYFINSSLALWSVSKKKPLCTVPNAHRKPSNSLHGDESIPDESWITSIASMSNTDLLASGMQSA